MRTRGQRYYKLKRIVYERGVGGCLCVTPCRQYRIG